MFKIINNDNNRRKLKKIEHLLNFPSNKIIMDNLNKKDSIQILQDKIIKKDYLVLLIPTINRNNRNRGNISNQVVILKKTIKKTST